MSSRKELERITTEVRAVIDRHDPEELLAHGALADEYKNEARSIALSIMDGRPITAAHIRDVWMYWFGVESSWQGRR
ncbi:MAG TPA: hypothetical protein VMN56_01315 [Casimicrobiaceae bacterium]|nr:hypothetical protein [Casimicrobiaceae bacterium]